MIEGELRLQSPDIAVARLGEIINYNFPKFFYLAQFEPPSGVFQHADPYHIDKHAGGSQIWGNIALELPEFRDIPLDRDAINDFLVLHDSGRNGDIDDPDHGIHGAEVAHNLLRDIRPWSTLKITTEVIKGHPPNGAMDRAIPPQYLQIMKFADKVELVRIPQTEENKLDRSKLPSPLIEEIFFPICDALYRRVDAIQEMFQVNGYRAMLLAGVELGIVDFR